MIAIDFKTGLFEVLGQKIETKNDVLLFSESSLIISNAGWVTYRLDLTSTGERFIFNFLFFEDSLKKVEIFSSTTSNENISNVLGGYRKYSWGKIELNEDKKANYSSVLISYH